MMTMKAFVIDVVVGDQKTATTTTTTTVGSVKADIPVPVPGKGEALVRVLRAGVCNTDLELLAG